MRHIWCSNGEWNVVLWDKDTNLLAQISPFIYPLFLYLQFLGIEKICVRVFSGTTYSTNLGEGWTMSSCNVVLGIRLQARLLYISFLIHFTFFLISDIENSI